MKKILFLALFLLVNCINSVFAQSKVGNDLNLCLSNATTGKDRVALTQWLYLSMAQHPSMKEVSTTQAGKKSATDKNFGELLTRLITKDCANEFNASAKVHGQAVITQSFAFLGQLAMQELMTNQAVAASAEAFQKHADMKKIQEVIGENKR